MKDVEFSRAQGSRYFQSLKAGGFCKRNAERLFDWAPPAVIPRVSYRPDQQVCQLDHRSMPGTDRLKTFDLCLAGQASPQNIAQIHKAALCPVLLPVQVNVISACRFQPVDQHLVVKFVEAQLIITLIELGMVQDVPINHETTK